MSCARLFPMTISQELISNDLDMGNTVCNTHCPGSLLSNRGIFQARTNMCKLCEHVHMQISRACGMLIVEHAHHTTRDTCIHDQASTCKPLQTCRRAKLGVNTVTTVQGTRKHGGSGGQGAASWSQRAHRKRLGCHEVRDTETIHTSMHAYMHNTCMNCVAPACVLTTVSKSRVCLSLPVQSTHTRANTCVQSTHTRANTCVHIHNT
jgi:hypothetical protein